MSLSKYFINRPKFAWVIAILMVLIGGIAIMVLPVAQYPQITPPQIIVQAEYPGANAQTLVETVAVPIENQLNGIDGVLYMSSSATDSGVYTLTITFNIGVDPDIAQVKVENRLDQAKPFLPEVVIQEGLSVVSQSANILAFLVLESPQGTWDSLYLSNYAYTNLKNPLGRLNGISGVNIYGPQNSIRVWLDPQKLAAHHLSAQQVANAIEQQNNIAGIGALGSAPSKNGKLLISLMTKGLLSQVSDFEQIILTTDKNGGILYLKDVGTVEIGADSYTLGGSYNNAPSVSMSLSQTPNSNALQIMKQVKKEMDLLTQEFAPDMNFKIVYDSTLYVRDSIQGIISTLMITFLLVIGVVYLFLQDKWATLIPSISIPVSLIATFMVIYLLGFDINILTLFALILAIGLVVDDAIIVVERVQYLMLNQHLNSFQAALQAMKDISSSIVATTFVLLSIFIPVALMAGITGKIYQQFALTISTAVVFSAINALTLSPALCALFLKPTQTYQRGFFALFNRFLAWGENLYQSGVRFLCQHLKLALTIAGIVILGISILFRSMPTAFIPQEDQGFLLANVQLPDTATFAKTQETLAHLSDRIRQFQGIEYVISIAGTSLLSASGENIGMAAIGLKPWDQRTTPNLSLDAIMKKLSAEFQNDPMAEIEFLALPAIPGVGHSDGISFQLNALNPKATPQELFEQLEKVLGDLNTNPHFAFAFSPFQANTPHLYLEFDREKLAYYQVPISAVFTTLENVFGSRYINNITLDGQINKVIMQADYPNRESIKDIEYLYVPTQTGKLIQLKDFIKFKTVLAPKIIYRYNQYTSAAITAQTQGKFTTGNGITYIKKLIQSLGNKFGLSWTGLSLQEVETQGLVLILITLAVIFSYLFLVALYESFLIALSVILTNIFAVMGAVLGLWAMDLPLSIYAQLGIVLLIGLASKNAILIVQFTTTYQHQGLSVLEAAVKGAKERFRAVLMTALTFILGVMPMLFASGAGAASQIAIGTTVFFGMIAATLIGILFVPAFFTVFDTIAIKHPPKKGTVPKMLLLVLLGMELAACKVGPDYQPPVFFEDKQLEKALDTPLSPKKESPSFELTELKDPALKQLLAQAQKNSPTLRTALLKIRQARALTAISKAGLFPTLDITGAYNYAHASKNMNQTLKENYYRLGFDALWELDIFGGQRRQLESTEAQQKAALWGLKQTQISLNAEIASIYYQLRTTETLLKKAQENVDLERKNTTLIQNRYDSGLTPDLEVKQSLSLLKTTEAQIPQLEQEVIQSKTSLAILVGELPGEIDTFLKQGKNPMDKKSFSIKKTYLELPLTVIRNRPDVQSAEQNLIAQNAQIGVAIANLFPKVSFSGFLGLESLHAQQLLRHRSYGYSAIPQGNLPLFHFGSLWANIEAQKALTDIQTQAYKSVLLTATGEVKSALVALDKEQKRNQKLYQAYLKASEVAHLIFNEYLNGLVSMSDVVSAEENRLSAQTNWIKSNGTLYQNLIAFYKATGGHLNAPDKD